MISQVKVVSSAVRDLGATHSLVRADGVNLGTEHNGGEDEEEESFKTQQDQQDHGGRGGKTAAL